MEIQISKAARQALLRSNKRTLLAAKIKEPCDNPDAQSANVKKLRGRAEYRLRVQDWRVIFRIEDEVLYIDGIEPRGSVYKDRT